MVRYLLRLIVKYIKIIFFQVIQITADGRFRNTQFTDQFMLDHAASPAGVGGVCARRRPPGMVPMPGEWFKWNPSTGQPGLEKDAGSRAGDSGRDWAGTPTAPHATIISRSGF